MYNDRMIEIHIRHGEASSSNGWGLTEDGKSQVEAAAAYLRSYFSVNKTIGIHSGSRRAMETAQLLGLGVEWLEDSRLQEVDWKGVPEPREFEPWLEMYTRVKAACKEWDANNGDSSRVIVSHGGTMKMIRAYREGLNGPRFSLLFEKPYKYFTNCQIIIYTNQNPYDEKSEAKDVWVKSVCPWNEKFGHDWMQAMDF